MLNILSLFDAGEKDYHQLRASYAALAAAYANAAWMMLHPNWSWADDFKYWATESKMGTMDGWPAFGGI